MNTGPWIAADGKPHGYFTTVWQREKGKWLWVYDGGDALKTQCGRTAPRRSFAAHHARPRRPGAPVIPPPPLTPKQARTTPEDNGRGESADRTLGWDWKVEKNGRAPLPRLHVERRALCPGAVQRRRRRRQ